MNRYAGSWAARRATCDRSRGWRYGHGRIPISCRRRQAVTYGTLSGEPIRIDPRLMISGRRIVEGFWLGYWMRERSIPSALLHFREIASLIRKGILNSEIGRVFPLEQIAEAAREAETVARHGKILLQIARHGADRTRPEMAPVRRMTARPETPRQVARSKQEIGRTQVGQPSSVVFWEYSRRLGSGPLQFHHVDDSKAA